MSAARRLRRGARSAAPLVLAALLAACAGRHSQQSAALPTARPAAGQGYYRIGVPYEIGGVWYYPRVDYHYDRTGVASWYGPDYDGRLTANGEIFDMNGISAAHPTLPLPSIVRVTNLQNGRSLDLRVNDRGPFVDGRIIDLSRRAAQLLGFEIQGTAPVRVKILKRRSIEVAELARQGIIADSVAVAQAAPAAEPAPLVHIASAALPGSAPLPPPLPPRVQPPKPAPVEIAAANPPPAYEPSAYAAPAYEPPAPAAPAYEPPAYEPPVPAPARVAEPWPAQENVDFVAYRPPPRHHVSLVSYRLPELHPVRPTADRPPEKIFVQAGAFSVRRNAWRVRARIAGLASVRVSPAAVNGVELYRVRLGPFVSVEQANRVLSRVIRSGCPGARLVLD